jgi:sigma-B regulation protein RsbU (phosphoserine phosphatase)
VGGDYYDFLELPDGRLGICIGDVAGKGLPAALLMSNLQAAVRAVAASGASPRELCRQVDAILRHNLAGRRFVSFFVAFLEAASGRLVFANAGHPPPLLLQRDGAASELATGGPVLGAFRGADYAEADVTLEPGDRLLLFTDGASEARDGADVELGEEGLRAILLRHREGSAEQLRQAVVEAVLAHSGGALLDDLTLVVVAAGERG